jgi:osmotically-inducible protein OsmY
MRSAQIVLLAVLLASPALMLTGCGKTVAATTDDAGVATRVKTALLNQPDLQATSITVSANSGVVTLAGTVRSDAEAAQAVAVARQMAGVSRVESHLEVSAR